MPTSTLINYIGQICETTILNASSTVQFCYKSLDIYSIYFLEILLFFGIILFIFFIYNR